MSSLVIAVPLVAQVSNAQSTGSTTSTATAAIPSQACVEAMANVENVRLSQFDTMNAKRKQSMQTRASALAAAAKITDDTERQDALKQIREDMKTEMESMKDSVPTEIQTAMDAVKTACGNTFMMRMDEFGDRHPMMGKMMDKAPAFIAEKLGMTEDELKAALDSGKTIKDIADEKGIDLPMPPHGARGMFFHQEINQ